MTEGQEPTPTPAEPASEPETGQEPASGPPPPGQEPGFDSLPEATKTEIRRLRAEAANHRKDAQELKAKVESFEESKKSDLEKAQSKATKAEKEAADARFRTMQYEAAAAAGLDLEMATRLQGEDLGALKKDAEVLAKRFAPATGGGMDGGPRGSTPRTGSMDEAIRGAAGRTSVGSQARGG